MLPENYPPNNCPLDDCPQNNGPRRKLPPHLKVSPLNNRPHLNKLLSGVPRVHWSKLCKSYFSRLQLRSKMWFTSVYFLQILTKPHRTPLIREHLSLNASWFSYERTQKKYNFLEKLIRKKIQKNFIVNNNNKIIRAWYLSSKWLVCRSIVNQTTEERAEQNWVPWLKQIS